METKINLCDECKKQVAEEKCKICEKDICKKCRNFLSIGLFSKLLTEGKLNTAHNRNNSYSYAHLIMPNETSGVALGGCYICKVCKKNLKVLAKKEHNDIIQKVIDYVKNEFVIEELEENGHTHKDK
jgi:YesN/AraC family two-component response regulator